MITIPIKNN